MKVMRKARVSAHYSAATRAMTNTPNYKDIGSSHAHTTQWPHAELLTFIYFLRLTLSPPIHRLNGDCHVPVT